MPNEALITELDQRRDTYAQKAKAAATLQAAFKTVTNTHSKALKALLRYTLPASESLQPGVCLALREELRALPVWTADQVTRYLHDQYRRYESLLALGAYHHLLPTEVRRRAVVAQFDVPRFLLAVGALQIARAPEALGQALQDLVAGGR